MDGRLVQPRGGACQPLAGTLRQSQGVVKNPGSFRVGIVDWIDRDLSTDGVPMPYPGECQLGHQCTT